MGQSLSNAIIFIQVQKNKALPLVQVSLQDASVQFCRVIKNTNDIY